MPKSSPKIGDNFPPIDLPPPRLDHLAPLRDAFRLRRTEHSFSSRMLEPQVLSDLLWAACGVNHPESGKRPKFGAPVVTDATASNAQEIDVYVALEQGLYLYDPEQARLVPILLGDLRPLAAAEGLPRSGDAAPVRLVYVADVDRLEQPDRKAATPIADPEMQKAYYLVDCGIVAANVYLFAAAAGLSAWFHECDRMALAKRLPLRAGRRVLFAQTVGYPA
jgi:nitroreductase